VASIETRGAVRTSASAIDPYRACLGLAAAAAARGARIHERSRVLRIKPSSRHVDVTLDSGTVRIDTVVVATAAPIADLRGLRRHLPAMTLYGVVTRMMPSAMRKQVGRRSTAVEDFAEPHRLVRWLAEDRIMVRGGRQPEVAPRLRDRTLSQRTGQLMYELSLMYPSISGLQPEWSWDSPDYDTVDGLPFVGPHRNYPRHLFAFTPSRHGAGLAWAAARLLVRRYEQAATRADDVFSFARIL
jgi:glycine/D-amino acid oxidase-like deaminating enzyme